MHADLRGDGPLQRPSGRPSSGRPSAGDVPPDASRGAPPPRVPTPPGGATPRVPPPPAPPPPPVGRTGFHEYEPSDHGRIWVLWAVLGFLGLAAVAIGILFAAGPPWSRQGRGRGVINAWARQEDGRRPLRAPEPTTEDWLTAYGESRPWRDDGGAAGLDGRKVAAVLRLLNSALLTAAVTPETIRSDEQARSLLDECQAIRDGRIDAVGLRVVGVTLPRGDDAFTARIVGWVNEVIQDPRRDEVNDVKDVQAWIDALRPLAVLAAPARNDVPPPDPQKLKAALAVVFDDRADGEQLDDFAQDVIANRAIVANATTLADLRLKLAPSAAVEDPPAPPDPAVDEMKRKKEAEERMQAEAAKKRKEEQADMARLAAEARDAAWQAFRERVHRASNQQRPWPAPGTRVPLVTEMPPGDTLDWSKLDLILASVGAWKPRAEREQDGQGRPSWRLLGLPADNDALWGMIRLEPDGAEGKKRLVFIAEKDAPWLCGFMPIVFTHPAMNQAQEPRTVPLRMINQRQRVGWTATGPTTWADLAGMIAAAGDGEQAPRQVQLAVHEPLLSQVGTITTVEPADPLVTERGEGGDKPGTVGVFEARSGQIGERFTWELDALTLTIKPGDPKPWAQRVGIEVGVKSMNEQLSGSQWVAVVTKLLEGLFPNHAGAIRVDLSKRIGVERVNDYENWRRNEKYVGERLARLSEKIMDPQASQAQKQALEREKAKDEEIFKTLPQVVSRKRSEIDSYAPWTEQPPADREKRSLDVWLTMAVDYAVKDGRYFRGTRDFDAAKLDAQDPGQVQAFLAREADWKTRVEATFSNTNFKDKAEQNELIALLVLAHLPGIVAVQEDRERIVAAFSKEIADTVKATISVDWMLEGEPEPITVPVADVIGAGADGH
jgi:hypothetical protein